MKKTAIFVMLFSLLCSIKAQTKLQPGDIIQVWDSINFDTVVNSIRIDTSEMNIWQIGRPQKAIFSASYSPENAMVTDTVNPYSVNNYSFFDLYVGNFNNEMYPWDIFVDFWHKYDTDSLKDGGFITVSWDKGITWANVIHDTNYVHYVHPPMSFYGQIPNLYTETDTLTDGNIGFSGNSHGWIKTILGWHAIPVKIVEPADTMIIRFNFISDSIQNNKAGWMIDDIRLYSVDLGGGVHDYEVDNLVKISPNPYSDKTEIRFDKQYKHIEIETYDLFGKLMGKESHSNLSSLIYRHNELIQGTYILKIVLDHKLTISKQLVKVSEK